MLSRVANSLYWMSRYIERAENIARIVDVNLQLLLDFRRLDDERLAAHWIPIVQSTGDDELFAKLYKEANGQTVTDFLTFQTENPNSIISSVAQARENARTVRDQITSDMWEEINRLYLFLRSPRAREVWKQSPYEFFKEVKSSSLFLQGLTDSTFTYGEGWNFMQVGKYIERADKTTRIIDVRSQSLPPQGAPTALSQSDALGWSAVLRSCSAWDAYRENWSADVDPERVVEFLVLNSDFPRSVEYCVAGFDSALRRISGVAQGRFSNQAEKLSGRLLAEVKFCSVDDIFKHGLHDYLDQLQLRFIEVGQALFDTYILHPFNDTHVERHQQQQQQQQSAGASMRVSV